MKRVIFIIISLFIISAPAHAIYDIDWTKTNGPYAGTGNLAVNPGVNHVYAAGVAGGFYRSLNGGASFERTYGGYSGFVAIDPLSPNKLYLAYYSGILSSESFGQKWTTIPGQFFTNNVNSIAIDPNDTSKIYATQNYSDKLYRLNIGVFPNTMEAVATVAGVTSLSGVIRTSLGHFIVKGYSPSSSTIIFLSTDEGTSWSSSEFSNVSFQMLSSGNKIFLVNSSKIYYSTDESKTWTWVNTTPFTTTTVIGVSRTDPNAIYAEIGDEVGLMTVSFDGGKTWARAYNGLPQIGARSIAVSTLDSKEAFALMGADGIYKTTDGGGHWVRASQEGFVNNYGFNLAVNRSNHFVYAGGNSYPFGPVGLWRSKDKGTRWERLTNGLLTGGELNKIAIDRSHAGHIYVGGGGGTGMFFSADDGDYWTAVNRGLTNRAVTGIAIDYDFPISGETSVYAATGGNGVYYGTDTGSGVSIWLPLPTLNLLDTNLTCLSLSTAGGGHLLYAGAAGGRVFRFNLSALSWEALGTPTSSAVSAVQVDPSDPNIVFAATGATGGGVYVSKDAGATWSKKLNWASPYLFIDTRTTPHTTYAGSTSIYRSSDGSGESWSPDLNYNNTLLGSNVVAVTNDEEDYTFFASSRYFGISKGVPQISVPQSPLWIIGTAESSSSIKWAWQQVTGEFGYKLKDGGNLIASLGENINYYTESGLFPNTQHTREAAAFATMESSPSPPDSQWTLANAPSLLRSTGPGGDFVHLNWNTNNNSPNDTKYVMEATTEISGGFFPGMTIEVTRDPPRDFTGLFPNTTYYFRVYALNHSGISTEPSNIITESTTHETRGPRIYNIRFDGILLLNNDPVRPSPLITAYLTDETVYPEPPSAISKESVTLYFSDYYVVSGNEIDSFVFTTEAGVPFYKLSHKLKSPLGAGTYQFYISAADDLGNVGSSAPTTLRQIGGSVQVMGTPLSYPTPFRPLDKTSGNLRISYTLSKDAKVDIYVYDVGGKIILTKKFFSGSNGGRTGYNDFQWNGTTDFGGLVGNGIFVYKIIAEGKVIGTGKIVVYD